MLDIQFIRENPDAVKDAARKKHVKCDIDKILELDGKRRELLFTTENLRAERNKIAKKGKDVTDSDKERMGQIKKELKESEPMLAEVDVELRNLLLLVPNIPSPDVPEGETDEDNVLVRKWGDIPEFDFDPKDHLELNESLKLFDFKAGAKVSGSRFYFLRGNGALLEMAVMRYAVDFLHSKGFEPFIVPMLVRSPAMEGTGFLPRGREEAYYVEQDDLFMVGTSEASLVSYHMNDIFEEADLPLHYAGVSSCFRREAGAAGRDTKGLYRVHQFQKIEQIVFCRNDPEESHKEHLLILDNAENLMQGLGLPYRVALACGGEIGIPQILKHEVEAWMPSRNSYSETQSCSTIHEYQSRRLNIKYRNADRKLVYAHTLNNTAVATPRILIPILENNQQKDGSVKVPDALVPYMNGIEVLEPK